MIIAGLYYNIAVDLPMCLRIKSMARSTRDNGNKSQIVVEYNNGYTSASQKFQ